jgi:serine/threonine-protein kinase
METRVRPGDVLLGKYRVERVLGQGGMGIVVAARHLNLDELYAIKVLRPEALDVPQAVERFLREARAAARLRGEHVAKVHDVGKLESGAPYMVMEYLDGSDLKKVIRTQGPLPAEEAAALMIQVCDAISEAHALGIVHRDLKPANLFLIRRPNGTPCMKVLDFGISKQLDIDAADLTKTGDLVGTPKYMAPEQMLRMKKADPRSDLWMIGVVLYELVTGQGPFHADSLPEVVARILAEEALPPSLLMPSVPFWLDAVVARCLRKNPEDRFQSAGELASALRAGDHAGPPPAPLLGRRRSAPSVPALAQSGEQSGEPQRASHGAATLPNAQASKRPSSGSITVSAWGRTGARMGRGAGRTGAALAAVLGLSVSGAGAYWVFRGRAPPAESSVAAAPIPVASEEPSRPAPPSPGVTTTFSPVAGLPSSNAVPGLPSLTVPAAAPTAAVPSVVSSSGQGTVSAGAPRATTSASTGSPVYSAKPVKPTGSGKYDLPSTRD